jgi:DNA-binding CsgD family transcriptional regulator
MEAAIAAARAPQADDPRILGDLYGRVLPTLAFVQGDLERLPGLYDTMIEHVRAAPPTTSVFPGRVPWAILRTIDDDDLGAAARAELGDAANRIGLFFHLGGVELTEAIALGRQGQADAAAARFEPAYTSLIEHHLGKGIIHCCALLCARAAIRDGWGDPVRWLRASEAFFATRGYERLARRCRATIGEAGAPVPRRGRGDSEVPAALRALGVTSREMDVLKLVAAGRTNKGIAEELFLSPKTVERHVGSLFTRLGVSNRRDLAARVGEHTA